MRFFHCISSGFTRYIFGNRLQSSTLSESFYKFGRENFGYNYRNFSTNFKDNELLNDWRNYREVSSKLLSGSVKLKYSYDPEKFIKYPKSYDQKLKEDAKFTKCLSLSPLFTHYTNPLSMLTFATKYLLSFRFLFIYMARTTFQVCLHEGISQLTYCLLHSRSNPTPCVPLGVEPLLFTSPRIPIDHPRYLSTRKNLHMSTPKNKIIQPGRTDTHLRLQSTSLRPAVSSSNSLPVNGITTPGDRGKGSDGSLKGSDGSSIMGMMEDGAKDVLDVTSSGGPQVEPVADLREAKGEVNRRADGRIDLEWILMIEI